MAESEKNKKAENKNSVIEFVEGWDMIQTLGEGAFGEYATYQTIIHIENIIFINLVYITIQSEAFGKCHYW